MSPRGFIKSRSLRSDDALQRFRAKWMPVLDPSIQRRLPAFTLQGVFHDAAFALQCIRTNGHWTRVFCMKAGSRFAVRKVSPAFGFAEPLPSVLGIKRGAVAAQQLHVTAACQVVHGASP
jgi:hypothetical protein